MAAISFKRRIPDQHLSEVFQFLEDRELCRIRAVSKQFNNVISRDVRGCSLIKEHFFSIQTDHLGNQIPWMRIYAQLMHVGQFRIALDPSEGVAGTLLNKGKKCLFYPLGAYQLLCKADALEFDLVFSIFMRELKDYPYNFTKNSILYHACSDGRLRVARAAIEAGASVQAHEAYGSFVCPLMDASREGHIAIVNLLLDCQADIHQEDRDGRTALHIAAAKGRAAVVQALLNAGAELNRGRYGYSSLDLAYQRGKESGDYEVYSLLKSAAQGIKRKQHPTAEFSNLKKTKHDSKSADS